MKEPDKEALLRTLCGLLALNLMKDKTKGEQIAIFAASGMSRREIAALVGTTPGTVSVCLSIAKKKSRKTKYESADAGHGPDQVNVREQNT